MKYKTLLALSVASVVLSACNVGGGGESSNANSDFVSQMAMKTQGDPSKLTPEERKKMDEITKGKTDEVIRFHPSSKMQPVDKK